MLLRAGKSSDEDDNRTVKDHPEETTDGVTVAMTTTDVPLKVKGRVLFL